MTKRFPLVLFGAGSLFLASPALASAQEPSASAPSSNFTLEQSLVRLDTIDGEAAKKVEALRTLIDQELMAKRITDSAAQSLRFGLKALSPLAGTEPLVNALSAARLPEENAALPAAVKSLEAEWTAGESERLTVIKKACGEVRTRVGTAARSAKSVTEIDSLLASIDRLQQAVPVRNTTTVTSLGAQHLSTYASILRSVRKIIDLQSNALPDAIALGAALSQLQSIGTSPQGVIDESAVSQRIEEAIAPFQKAQDEAQERVEALLQAAKPSKEITAAVVSLEEAMERFPSVQATMRKRDLAPIVEIYRILASARGALDEGKFAQAKGLLGNMRPLTLQSLGPTKIPVFTQLIATWNKSIEDGAATAGTKRREDMRARLAAVKRPADLEALSLDLAKIEAENRERDSDFPRGLAAQLNALAAAWATSNPNLSRLVSFESGDVRFSGELADLRRRVERDVLAGSLRLPELVQPPLAEKPLDEAIDAFTAQLAEKGEWRRMLQIVEARTSGEARFIVPGGDVDLVGALRAYITGQNMELAEQWVEAMQSYKTVLRSTSERAPTKQAAERVKALTREHAELFRAAATTGAAPAKATPAPKRR